MLIQSFWLADLLENNLALYLIVPASDVDIFVYRSLFTISLVGPASLFRALCILPGASHRTKAKTVLEDVPEEWKDLQAVQGDESVRQCDVLAARPANIPVRKAEDEHHELEEDGEEDDSAQPGERTVDNFWLSARKAQREHHAPEEAQIRHEQESHQDPNLQIDPENDQGGQAEEPREDHHDIDI